MSAVCCVSFIGLELWCLHPCALIIPCSSSIWFLGVLSSSLPSKPVSANIVNIVAYFLVDADIIFFTDSVVGIRGIILS